MHVCTRTLVHVCVHSGVREMYCLEHGHPILTGNDTYSFLSNRPPALFSLSGGWGLMSSSPYPHYPGSKKATAITAAELGQSLREQEGSAELPDGGRRDSRLFTNLHFKCR